MKRIKTVFLAVFLGLVMLVPVNLKAQEQTGSVQGVVSDPTGAVLVGADVSASCKQLVRPVSTKTDNSGAYHFTLPPGACTISYGAPWFNFLNQPVTVQVGRTMVLDQTLQVEGLGEIVQVSAEAPPVDIGSSVVATNVTPDDFERLPTGRSYLGLIAMAPGVRPEPKQGGFQVDGASGSENSWIVDGVETTHPQFGTQPAQSQDPFQWVGELQVKSSSMEAQYGGATGGVVNVITKRGTNEFHGQFSLNVTSDVLHARPRPTLRLNPFDDEIAEYFDNSRDGVRYLNPGYDLGGPIIKNRVLFFSSSRPVFNRVDRTVTFLRNNQTRTLESRTRQDFTLNRIDVAPTDRLRGSVSYRYTPIRVNGFLPSRQGTDSPTTPFADLGYRAPATSYQWRVDGTINPNLLVEAFGGWSYLNYKDYGVPRGTFYRFANTNTNLPPSLPVPPELRGPAGNFTPNNRQTLKDEFTRNNVNGKAVYYRGAHEISGGYQLNRLHNAPVAGTWPDGRVDFFWNASWRGITRPGVFRGPYGFAINRVFITTGDVVSRNQGFFVQDKLRLPKRWTGRGNAVLTLGLRTEDEYVPSFRTDSGIPSRAIQFGYGDKLTPRVGVAYDPTGKGNVKIYGGFGYLHSMMLYEMPRGSFGGDRWKDYVYPLNSQNFLVDFKPQPAPNSHLGTFPGQPWEVIDWRIPSNDPAHNLIEPNLKPMGIQVIDVGADYNPSGTTWVISGRFTHKKLKHAIEDVGILTPEGEQYSIANPGYGVTVDPARFPAGFKLTPKAQRDYSAIELRAKRRFSKNYLIDASYIWSRLYGNYGGLASSDENGRTSPNVNRYFDLPWMNYDAQGSPVYGRLATDRPHTFKMFASRDLKSRFGVTSFSPVLFVGSGTPLTTEVEVISTTPMYINGRGDLGRTPIFSNSDVQVAHEFRAPHDSEKRRVRIEMVIGNLFNQSTVTNTVTNLAHPNDGHIQFDNIADVFKGFNATSLMRTQSLRTDPRYRTASGFQGPRSVSFAVKYNF